MKAVRGLWIAPAVSESGCHQAVEGNGGRKINYWQADLSLLVLDTFVLML
jgi:hypothetical protein